MHHLNLPADVSQHTHGRQRDRPGGTGMKLTLYEHLFEMNRGFDQVVRCLKSLEKYRALKPDEIRRFEQMAKETQAATNSHLLDLLAALEINRAGRLSRLRKARERREEQEATSLKPPK